MSSIKEINHKKNSANILQTGLKNIQILGQSDLNDATTAGQLVKVSTNGEMFVKTLTGGQASQMKANTQADGQGTEVFVVADANGNLKVKEVGTVNIAPANSANGEMSPSQSFNVSNSKITVGQDVKAAGSNLQQVLIYGRKADSTLQPLECNGDRLLVDVVELASSGPISTSSALSSIQICGIKDSDSRFKTIRVDDNGNQYFNHSIEKQTDEYSSQSLTGNGFWATKINSSNHSKLSIIINSNATSSLMLYGSDTENGTYLPFKTVMIVNEATGDATTANIGFVELESPPNFIQIKNITAGGITLNIVTVRSN